MTDAFGAVTWWGFSPALDLQEKGLSEALQKLTLEKDENTINILLVGSGDCRHVLKTIAQSYRWPKKALRFYIVENNLEVLARHLLLMAIALEPKERLGLQEKTELFLELFGNSLVRPQTSEYLQQKANQFIKMVTDEGFLKDVLPLFDFSQLKFKERDMLEAIFKFWRNTDPKIFDICKCWEGRVRHHLGVRYDSRQNAYDWSHSMHLKEKASIVNFYEYRAWREQGVAFELRSDSTYEVSNRTLASGLIITRGGEKVAQRGYWGDIINSPFLSFGIESEDQSLFKVANKVHTKTSTNVSEYNVTALMYELMNKRKYIPPKTSKKEEKPSQATITEITEEEEEEEEEAEANNSKTDSAKSKTTDVKPEYMKVEDVKVTFLPLNCVPDLPKKSKYTKLFNTVYFSNSMVHLLTPELKPIFADDAKVILETTKFMLELKEEVSQEFVKKITSMAESAGCKATNNFQHDKDAHCFYSFKNS